MAFVARAPGSLPPKPQSGGLSPDKTIGAPHDELHRVVGILDWPLLTAVLG
jgi:hypothetical protein